MDLIRAHAASGSMGSEGNQPGTDIAACKFFLAGLILLSSTETRNPRLRECIDLLNEVPGDPELAGLLSHALSCAAVWLLSGGAKTSDADRVMDRAVKLPGFETLDDARPPFAALICRLTRKEGVSFGPGSVLPGRKGTIANLNSLAARLPVAADACFLTSYLSAYFKIFNFLPKDMEEMARGFGGSGFPNLPLFKLAWEALTLRVSVSAGSPGAASAALARVEELASSGALAPLASARRSVAESTLSPSSRISADLGTALGALGPEDVWRAVAALAPLLAGAEISAPAFSALLGPLSLARPLEFQAAMMKAAGEGLFGDGLPALHAVVAAGLTPFRSARRLSSYGEAVSALKDRAAGSAGGSGADFGPGGSALELCLAFVAAEESARSPGDPTPEFKALADLRTGGADAEAFAWTCAAALVSASWGPGGGRPSPQGGAMPSPDPLVLGLLETVFPEPPLKTPALGEIVRNACCYAMAAAKDPVSGRLAEDGLSDSGALVTAFMPDKSAFAELPEIAEAGALAAVMHMGDARPSDKESFRTTLQFSCRCLSRQLPLGVRSRLVHACIQGLGCLGLDRELKGMQALYYPVYLDRTAERAGEPVDDTEGSFGSFASEPSFMVQPQVAVLSRGMLFRLEESGFADYGPVKSLILALGSPPAEDAAEARGGFPQPDGAKPTGGSVPGGGGSQEDLAAT
ncbi:MAG: hypothetical protein LBQ12_15090 [Deltaproteobacteria bacterium]|jgi:hypothetical protein|nr:hypothetical protein [Deltaproteobacteria bacterium]